MVGGIVGAKAWYIVEHWSAFILEPKAYLISGGGLVWYGGLVGGFIAATALMLFHKQSFRKVADAVSPSLAIGLAIGRIG